MARSTSKHAPGPTLVRWHQRRGSHLRPVLRGKYGVVRITKGYYAGNLGFYDDDEDLGRSIVYPWGAAPAGYVVVRHSSLAQATVAEARLWGTVNQNPFAQRSVMKSFEGDESRKD